MSSITRPIVEEERPWRSERARSLRWKPRSAIAADTRSAVGPATPGSSLITRETVLRLTPARSATSRIVGRERVAGMTSDTVLLLRTTMDDNVVRSDRMRRRAACQGAIGSGGLDRRRGQQLAHPR